MNSLNNMHLSHTEVSTPFPIESVCAVGHGVDHSEGIATGSDGFLYAGGECGQLYRILPDGKMFEEIACTGGFSLGITLDRENNIYVCDTQLHAVLRVDPNGNTSRYADQTNAGPLRSPNFSVFDAHGNLYVSDSGTFKGNNGRICRVQPNGKATVFHPGPFAFANGLAINAQEDALFVIESNRDCITRIEIKRDGTAGERTHYCDGLAHVPDGMAFDAAGNLYVGCYGLNRIYFVNPQGQVSLFCEDLENYRLSSPTNIAFGGEHFDQLYVGLLGARYLAKLDLKRPGMPLYAHRF